jgi:hypothetical protein
MTAQVKGQKQNEPNPEIDVSHKDRTSLGTSVSNSDFDLGYTGLKAGDFSLLEGGHSYFDFDF